jgi:hypothetical protein
MHGFEDWEGWHIGVLEIGNSNGLGHSTKTNCLFWHSYFWLFGFGKNLFAGERTGPWFWYTRRLGSFDRLFQSKYCPRRCNVWYNIVIAKETEISQALADGIDESFPSQIIFIWANNFHRFDSVEVKGRNYNCMRLTNSRESRRASAICFGVINGSMMDRFV